MRAPAPRVAWVYFPSRPGCEAGRIRHAGIQGCILDMWARGGLQFGAEKSPQKETDAGSDDLEG